MENNTRQAVARHRCDGFTLVELMIAIGVALILIIGVGYVFRKAGDTVSIGQALSTLARDNRALQATMNEDFENIAFDTPVLIIQCRPQIGYIDVGDYQTDTGSANGGVFNPTQSGPAIQTSQVLQVPTVHRQDVLAFCTRGKYQRRASAAGLTDTTSSAEAFVWYGMLAMLDNQYGTYWWPAQGDNNNDDLAPPSDNPNNFYGTQWTLGRMCFLLRPDAASVDASFPGGSYYFPPPDNSSTFVPLQGGAYAWTNGKSTGIPMEANVVDLVATNIRTFNNCIMQEFNNAGGGAGYAGDLTGMPTPSVPSAAGALSPSYYGVVITTVGGNTGTLRAFKTRNWVAKPFIPARVNGNGNATNGPVYTVFDQSSQMAASLMPGVTQFIVEYAGDYFDQDPATGAIKSIWTNSDDMGGSYNEYGFGLPPPGPTDGKLDFIVDPDGSHRIRWYGFPRDVAGGGSGLTVQQVAAYAANPQLYLNNPAVSNRPDSIIPSNGKRTTSYGSAVSVPYMPDVVPLRDLIQTCPISPNTPVGIWSNVHAPFEFVTSGGSEGFAYWGSADSRGIADYVADTGLVGAGHTSPYTCIWGPQDRRPWLIRVTITVNDPNRAVRDGQTFEYVFNLPH